MIPAKSLIPGNYYLLIYSYGAQNHYIIFVKSYEWGNSKNLKAEYKGEVIVEYINPKFPNFGVLIPNRKGRDQFLLSEDEVNIIECIT